RGIFESVLQLDTNSSLMRRRILWRFLAEDREGVRAIVVDHTRQKYPHTAGLPCSDCVVNHRQDQFIPVSVAGGIHGVDAGPYALGRGENGRPVTGIALHPFPSGRTRRRTFCSRKRAYFPPVPGERESRFAADTTARADHKSDLRCARHFCSPYYLSLIDNN